MKVGIIGIMLASALMVGCGNPSKSDVCGSCSAEAKGICELAYDSCDDDGDCIESLEDSKICG
jgi:hypothetical protein